MSDKNENKALAPQEIYEKVLDLQDNINCFEQLIETAFKRLKPGVDYGVPGGDAGVGENKKDGKKDKPCLLQPAAQKLAIWFNLTPEFEEKVSYIPVADGPEIISADIIFRLRDSKGVVRGISTANCNSYEKKYRSRSEWVAEWELPDTFDFESAEVQTKQKKGGGTFKKYRVKNTQSAFDLENTIKKMAQKRGFVGATLMATAMSGYFSQDLDELEEGNGGEDGHTQQETTGRTRPRKGGQSNPNKPADPGGSLEERKAFATDLLDKCVAGKAIPAENSWAGQINNATDKNIGRIIETLTASYEKIPTDKRAPESKPAPADPDPAGPTAAEIKTQARKIAKDLLDGGQLDQSSWDAWDEKIANAIPAEAAGVLSKLEALAKEGKAA